MKLDQVQQAQQRAERVARNMTVGPLHMMSREHPDFGEIYVAIGDNGKGAWAGVWFVMMGGNKSGVGESVLHIPGELPDVLEDVWQRAVAISDQFKERGGFEKGWLGNGHA